MFTSAGAISTAAVIPSLILWKLQSGQIHQVSKEQVVPNAVFPLPCQEEAKLHRSWLDFFVIPDTGSHDNALKPAWQQALKRLVRVICLFDDYCSSTAIKELEQEIRGSGEIKILYKTYVKKVVLPLCPSVKSTNT